MVMLPLLLLLLRAPPSLLELLMAVLWPVASVRGASAFAEEVVAAAMVVIVLPELLLLPGMSDVVVATEVLVPVAEKRVSAVVAVGAARLFEGRLRSRYVLRIGGRC